MISIPILLIYQHKNEVVLKKKLNGSVIISGFELKNLAVDELQKRNYSSYTVQRLTYQDRDFPEEEIDLEDDDNFQESQIFTVHLSELNVIYFLFL